MFCTNAGWDQYLKNIDMLRGLGRATYRCRVTSLNRGMRGKGELVSVDADFTDVAFKLPNRSPGLAVWAPIHSLKPTPSVKVLSW